MRILALNPFHSGSHKTFLESWINHSEHEFTLMTLPGKQWKWRMRHAAMSFSLQIREETASQTESWDLIFTTDMLNLAELKGLLPKALQACPTVLYFHENQFEYPSRLTGEKAVRDEHFAFTNFISLLSADSVWFNSEFHRSNFFDHVDNSLKRMPKLDADDRARWIKQVKCSRDSAKVFPPGIEQSISVPERSGPLHIAWVGRWEHDKNPDQFFQALRNLKESGGKFQLSVFGESFQQSPKCFEDARQEFSEEIVHFGYVDSKEEYQKKLQAVDVVVSTAMHEFFGIAVIEAMNTGCIPILPERLSYPELVEKRSQFLYDGSTNELVSTLKRFAALKGTDVFRFQTMRELAMNLSQRFEWSQLVVRMDQEIESIVSNVHEHRT